jgi:hypothetical protein
MSDIQTVCEQRSSGERCDRCEQAAAFLDRLASQMDELDVIIDAADCRAMAAKLRSET